MSNADTTLWNLGEAVVAADELLTGYEDAHLRTSDNLFLKQAAEAASTRYFGLRESLSLVEATCQVDALIQLGEAQASVDRLGNNPSDEEAKKIEQHLLRLLFSVMNQIERDLGSDLDQMGLHLLRARYRNPWATDKERVAAGAAVR